MARNFAGGTDRVWWVLPNLSPNVGTISFWMRTTQTTANAIVLAYWSGTSRNGWGLLISSNKLVFQGYDSSAARAGVTSTSNINGGTARHVVITYGRANGNGCTIYIDGASEATSASTASWAALSPGHFMQAADPVDTFWPSYVGELWDIAHWRHSGVVLGADEIAALAKGFSPRLIRPSELEFFAPLVRDVHCLKGNAINNSTGGTVTAHGRSQGGCA